MFLYLCFALLCVHSASANNFEGIKYVTDSFRDTVQFWIPTLDSRDEKCREHSQFYLKDLENFKLWATEMFDASAKFPSGILYGSGYALGNFDQCVEIRVPYQGEEFSGKYCMIKVKVTPPSTFLAMENITSFEDGDYEKSFYNISTWEKMSVFYEDVSKVPRHEIYVSLCLPSSCSDTDLSQGITEIIKSNNRTFEGLNITVEVDKNHCQTLSKYHVSKSDFVFIFIVVCFMLIVSMCSIYDLMSPRSNNAAQPKMPKKLHSVLLCFSFTNNLKKLASTSKNIGGLDCLAGIRVITMFLIIIGHRCMFLFGSPMMNPPFIEQMYSKFEAATMLNGPIVVDTFFAISGFLACYLTIMSMKTPRHYKHFYLLYVHRILRMTPSYAIVLAFYCTIFVSIGSGPFWQERIGVEQERCLQSWWANLLYINNYVNTDKICMFQSWFLTCDIHYFLAVPILVMLYKKQPTVAILVVLFIILMSILAILATVYIYNEDAILLLYTRLLRDPTVNETYKTIYIPSHLRASPYFLGILAGFIKHKLDESEYKISKKCYRPGWIVIVILGLATAQAGFVFYLPGMRKVSVIPALYSSLYHVTWSIAMLWFIIMVPSGKGRWVEPLLTWKPFMVLSRITFTTFLCHGAVQLYTTGVMRQPNYANVFKTFYFGFGDIIMSYAFGFLVSIFFEAPIIGLEKLLFGKKYTADHKDTTEEDESTIPRTTTTIKTIS